MFTPNGKYLYVGNKTEPGTTVANQLNGFSRRATEPGRTRWRVGPPVSVTSAKLADCTRVQPRRVQLASASVRGGRPTRGTSISVQRRAAAGSYCRHGNGSSPTRQNHR